MNRQLVIWDWNGTLLNDVDACVEAMNIMLMRRGKETIDEQTYKEKFTFPVQNYYRALGYDFTKEPFEQLSVEYISLYNEISKNSPLQLGSESVLETFQKNGYKQIIISASEQNALEFQVSERGIEKYFDSIIGLKDIYAKSKIDNAIDYIQNNNEEFDRIIFIGDTYHDYEVAEAIGATCILVNNGHQDLICSKKNGYKVVDSLISII